MSNEPDSGPGPADPTGGDPARSDAPIAGDPHESQVFVNGEWYPAPPYAAALLDDDPPQVGQFWLDARLGARPSGVTFLAHGPDEKSVMLIVLSEGAAADAAARDRLAGEVNKMHIDTVVARGGQGQDDGRLAEKYRNEDDDPVGPNEVPIAPWVALAFDGTMPAVEEADRILRSVDLSMTPSLGSPAGPDYKLHWIDEGHPGGWRLWPLPWPARRDRAGWMTMLVSFLLMLALAALALLIVVLIFQNTPPESPQPPVPTNQSQSGSPPPSGSESPQSGSPSESEGSESASPSEDSGSPSESGSESGSPSPSEGSESGSPSPSDGHDSPSREPSMMSSGPSGSAPATPSPNRRL